MTEKKVDIFDFMRHVDDGDVDYYDSLSDDERKSLSLVVAARWLTCTKNTKQIVSMNSLVNPLVYKFASKHPSLLYKMMLLASSGTQKQYKWVGKKKTSKKPETAKAISEYYGISIKDAERCYLSAFTSEEILGLGKELGYDDASMKKLKNEQQ